MIAARSGRTDITNILLEGEHVNLDIQENVSTFLCNLPLVYVYFSLHRLEIGQLSISLQRKETQLQPMLLSKQELTYTLETRSGIDLALFFPSPHSLSLLLPLHLLIVSSPSPSISIKEWVDCSRDC